MHKKTFDSFVWQAPRVSEYPLRLSDMFEGGMNLSMKLELTPVWFVWYPFFCSNGSPFVISGKPRSPWCCLRWLVMSSSYFWIFEFKCRTGRRWKRNFGCCLPNYFVGFMAAWEHDHVKNGWPFQKQRNPVFRTKTVAFNVFLLPQSSCFLLSFISEILYRIPSFQLIFQAFTHPSTLIYMHIEMPP